MSCIEQKTVTTLRHEYRIPSPACWTDVQTAFQMAVRDREAKGLTSHSDDSIRVEGDDESQIVFWEETA